MEGDLKRTGESDQRRGKAAKAPALPSPSCEALARAAREALRDRGLTIRQAAKEIGIPHEQLRRALAGENTTLLTADRIARALHLSLTIEYEPEGSDLAKVEAELSRLVRTVRTLRAHEQVSGSGATNVGNSAPVVLVGRKNASDVADAASRSSVEVDREAAVEDYGGLLEVVAGPVSMVGVRLAGVLTGDGIRQVAEDESDIVLVPEVVLPRGDYILRVSGDAFTDAGIRDGEILILRRAESVEPGQLVLAFVGERPVIGRYVSENGEPKIVSEGDGARILARSADGFRIDGVIAAIERYT